MNIDVQKRNGKYEVTITMSLSKEEYSAMVEYFIERSDVTTGVDISQQKASYGEKKTTSARISTIEIPLPVLKDWHGMITNGLATIKDISKSEGISQHTISNKFKAAGLPPIPRGKKKVMSGGTDDREIIEMMGEVKRNHMTFGEVAYHHNITPAFFKLRMWALGYRQLGEFDYERRDIR